MAIDDLIQLINNFELSSGDVDLSERIRAQQLQQQQQAWQRPAQKALRICVTGAGGFIGSLLAKRLKSEGHYVVAADRKQYEFWAPSEFCDEFYQVDLRKCVEVTAGCDHVYNLAADMGGMCFIQSNESVLMWKYALCLLPACLLIMCVCFTATRWCRRRCWRRRGATAARSCSSRRRRAATTRRCSRTWRTRAQGGGRV